MAWLAVTALLLTATRSIAGVSKEAIASVSCETCEMAVEEAYNYARDNKVKEEDDLADLVDSLCSVKKKVGRWVSKLDIIQETPGEPLTLDKQELIGFCKSECTIISRACQNSLRGQEETLVSLLSSGSSPKKMKGKICKKACSKKRPKMTGWKDEPFQPRDQKEVETEDMMAKMKAETGMGMKMYKREDLMGMSEGDMETMAAREAFAHERQAARMAEKEL
eukprot:TRINITY_DN7973_c0_g1_i1.p1 TRINITY_DN7973_c0_g1~~TRINITY_DN7973_c0_g1_i1.p1  ORF type:complete len:222 (-),score=66.04 TRINITY_DN7973_c0_g1_i1:124-789(-)